MSSALILHNNKPFLNMIMICDKKWILHGNQWWTKKKHQSTSQSQTFIKRKKKSYGQCLAVCCPPDPLQLSESQQNHYIWEVCSANQWDALKTATPAAGIGQQNGPNSPPHHLTTRHTTKASQFEWIGLWSFASHAIFTWPLTNWLPLLQASQQLFPGKMLPQLAGGRKCFPRVHWIPKHRFLHDRNKKTYCWQKCVDCMSVLVTQSCPALCDPMDWGPPGSSIHGIFQARVLEWGAIAFSGNFTRLVQR